MKTILSIALSSLFLININAQTTQTTTLLPDQNPNFQKSRDKYMQEAETLTKKEGQTIQQTYKAIDDVELKKERRQQRIQNRQDRRMARINARGMRRSNRGFNNNWQDNNWQNNNFPYNYNNNNSYWNQNPGYYSNNIYGNVNSVLNTALLGLTIWSILKN